MKFYFLLAVSTFLFSFKAAYKQADTRYFNKCNTAKEIGYLTQEEKLVIYYINIVRTNPKLFASKYLKSYLDTAPIKKTAYLKSLINELNSMQSLELLEPQYDLYEIAKKHAIEMGIHGKTGHVTANGESYENRANNLSKRYEKALENCQYGYSDALSVVIDLLIDEDIPDLGHRKSLLNKDVKYIGTAIRKHKVYRFNCVIELGYQLK
jgi:uncharacterized protein YkwD